MYLVLTIWCPRDGSRGLRWVCSDYKAGLQSMACSWVSSSGEPWMYAQAGDRVSEIITSNKWTVSFIWVFGEGWLGSRWLTPWYIFYKIEVINFNHKHRRAVVFLSDRSLTPFYAGTELRRCSCASELDPCHLLPQFSQRLAAHSQTLASFLASHNGSLHFSSKRLIYNPTPFYGRFLQKVTQSHTGLQLVWVPAERQRFNENKDVSPHREQDFNINNWHIWFSGRKTWWG